MRRLFPLLLLLTACQSAPKIARGPDAAPAPAAWREFVTDEPATFLDTRDTRRRLDERRARRQALRECGLDEHGGVLETDLLFIRLENWPPARLEDEYRARMSPQTLRCLRARTPAPGV